MDPGIFASRVANISERATARQCVHSGENTPSQCVLSPQESKYQVLENTEDRAMGYIETWQDAISKSRQWEALLFNE